ncbi:hypothetical protein K7X08_015182 [Anisodus acutangulus]|uniref:PRA1 family protein n=1 Tax=Anisodus acutangulus TaxID=402998 RepID=A0A9Q1QWG2_9SOLA|nr:hypothetical protein K7X08_015182 [Anisodus acutangulus]
MQVLNPIERYKKEIESSTELILNSTSILVQVSAIPRMHRLCYVCLLCKYRNEEADANVLFTFNPFAKLRYDDFSADTLSWTSGLVESLDSYSLPSSNSQAKLRVHENVKRYARNYASLFVLFFACSLYQKLLALVGLISCLALWDVLKLCGECWGLEQRPVIKQSLIRIAQCVTAVILFCTNVQMALISAIAVSYAVMILHASFRKLTPSKQSTSKDGNRRILRS